MPDTSITQQRIQADGLKAPEPDRTALPATASWPEGQPRSTLQQASSPSRGGQWPQLAFPGTSACIKADMRLRDFIKAPSFDAGMLRAFGDALTAMQPITGLEHRIQFESALEFLLHNGHARNGMCPARQMECALLLAKIVCDMNRCGVRPSILEIGAGPSFDCDTEYQAPWAARVLGMMVRHRTLDASIMAADPLIVPQYEALFGIAAVNARIDVLPLRPLEELEGLLGAEARSDLRQLFNNRATPALVEHLIHRNYFRVLAQAESAQREALRSGETGLVDLLTPLFEVRALRLEHVDKLDQLAGSSSALRRKFIRLILPNCQQAAENAHIPAALQAEQVVQAAPFDIVFSQNEPNIVQICLPLVRAQADSRGHEGRRYAFPWCCADVSYGQTISAA